MYHSHLSSTVAQPTHVDPIHRHTCPHVARHYAAMSALILNDGEQVGPAVRLSRHKEFEIHVQLADVEGTGRRASCNKRR